MDWRTGGWRRHALLALVLLVFASLSTTTARSLDQVNSTTPPMELILNFQICYYTHTHTNNNNNNNTLVPCTFADPA